MYLGAAVGFSSQSAGGREKAAGSWSYSPTPKRWGLFLLSEPSSPEEGAVCPRFFAMELESKDSGWALEVKLALQGCRAVTVAAAVAPSLVLLEASRALVNRQGWEGLFLGASQ